MEGKHFHPKGKLPSGDTIEQRKQRRESLPFSDERDCEEAKRAFIAPPPYEQTMAEAGHGNREVYEQSKTMLVHFDFGFEMMLGTGATDLTPEQKPSRDVPVRTESQREALTEAHAVRSILPLACVCAF